MAQNTENTEQSCQSVTLCSGGCGFFGNPQFDGMCSKCYKDALKRKQATNPPQEAVGRSTSPLSAAAISAAASSFLNRNSIETGSPTVTVPKVESSAPEASTSSTSSGSTDTASNTEGAVASAATAAVITDKDKVSVNPSPSSEERPDTPSTPETKTKKRNRCGTCKKKVGLTGFECRCGGLYCSMHRYSDKHACQFDYKKEGEDLIRKNNPVVVGSKLQKI